MSEANAAQVEETPVETQPEAITEQVATPESETEAVQEESQTQAEVPKTFTQEEVDKIAQKERSKAARKAEREYQAKLERIAEQNQSKQQQPTQVANGEPKLEDYEHVQDYVKAVARFELNQEKAVERQRQDEIQRKAVGSKIDKIFDEAEKLGNFDREEFANADLYPVSPAMAETILDSDIPAAIVKYLSDNSDETIRIAALSPARQAAEIGKLEVKLQAAAKVSKSNAPKPVNPIGSRGGKTHKTPAEMSLQELREFEKARGSKFI